MTRVKIAPRPVRARTAVRPLGEILVERGALTRPELDDVLREQQQTHQRLGALLVLRGRLSPAELTDALKTQIDVLGPAPSFERDGILRSVARAMRPLPDMTRDLDRRAREAARRSGPGSARTADMRTAAELADLRAEINHVYRLVVSQGAELAQLRARDPAAVEAPEAPAPNRERLLVESETHVLFKPAVAGGYELIERESALPAQGVTVEIDDRRFVVTRLGRSPLPGDTRVCAYLHAE